MATNDVPSEDAVSTDNTTGKQAEEPTKKVQNGKRKIPRELRDLADFNKAPTKPDSPTSSAAAKKEEVVVQVVSDRRSRRRSTPSAAKKAKTCESTTTTSKKKSKTTKEQDQLDMSWICVACREAECAMNPDAELLVCEGPCKRLFHTPCAGLASLPEGSWKCHDCAQGRHLCGFCQEYGLDNEDVFRCQKPGCGFFFHEACLEMQTIAIDRPPETTENATAAPKLLKFTCPAHWCWTCTQDDLRNAAALEEKKGTKPKAKSKSKGSLFSQKRETRLFQCMECPISYHLTCIPPLAKFHELALLCHEHADKAELPALDMEASYQGGVEARCDAKLQKIRHWDNLLAKRAKGKQRAFQPSKNPFFPRGVFSDKRTKREAFVFGKLGGSSTDNDDAVAPDTKDSSNAKPTITQVVTDWMFETTSANDRLLFCLPADVQEEVHSKPPLYKHIHALKYYPENKPKRIPLSKDVCNCVDACDDHCLNRLLYVECFGTGKGTSNGGKSGTNCRLGPTCGNRQLAQRRHVKKCKPKRERGKGWGLVTMEPVKKGALVQEYLGDVIDEKEKERRLIQWNLEHPNDPNYYIMCLSQGWYVDARETANMARFINHSCDPNCILTRFNVGGFMRDGIFAMRDLQPGEFLSYDYHFDTKQGDKFLCRCGSANCRGTMKEKTLEKDSATKKTKSQLWNEAKQQYEKDEKFLADLEERQKQNATIGAVLPGTSKALAQPGEQGTSIKDEWVSNGIQNDRKKERGAAIRNRIFLWRNAVAGSDFEARFGRYDFPAESTEGAANGEGQPIRRKRSLRKELESSKPKATVDMFALLAAEEVALK